MTALPGDRRISKTSELSSIDATVGDKVWVEEQSRFYEAAPATVGKGVPGPRDITPISWIPAVEAPFDGKWFNDLSQPAAFALDARLGVTATGTDIDSWADQSGCGANATQTGSNRPTYSATGWSDGGPAVSFAAASSQCFDVNATATKFYGVQKKSMVALVRLAAATSPTFFAHSKTTAYSAFGGYSNYGQIDSGTIVNSARTASAIFSTSPQRDTLVVYNHADGAGNSYIYCDGRKYSIANDAMDGTLTDMDRATVGAINYNGTYANMLNGLMRFISVHSGTFSDAEYKWMCRNLLGGVYTRVVCDGNSLTAGGFGGGGYYPTTLQALLGARALGRFEVDNTGVGGQTTDDMITRYPTYVAPKYSACQHNVLVAWELSNQYVGNYNTGGTARQAVDKFWQYCDTARAAGFRVVALTAIKREAAGYTPIPSKALGDAAIDEMNTYVRAEWQSHADSLVDPDTHPFFSNTAYTTVYIDGTHLSQAGCDVIAGLVAREVLRQIAVMA